MAKGREDVFISLPFGIGNDDVRNLQSDEEVQGYEKDEERNVKWS